MMIKKYFFALISMASGLAHATFVHGYDVSKSWEKAIAYVPGNFLAKAIDDIKVDRPLPVVIFLHGCGGIHEHEKKWAEFLKSEGFIVVLPNSFGIPSREINCISATNTTNIGKVPVNDLRPAEAEYAMLQVKEQRWADKNNIFLMGHSEGGMGAFLTKEVGFRGVIVSGFPCFVRQRVGSADSTPFLALNWQTDPYFESPGFPYRQCSDKPFWKNRVDSNELILRGKGHATAFEKAALDAVSKFLRERKK